MTTPRTLPELLRASASGHDVAVIVPEVDTRVTYESLWAQVGGVADALASAGIRRGERVAIALPNGLPAIVSFLGASTVGTAAPLNPGYRYEEFCFYLEDTAARLLLCPREGADEARRAAATRGIPVLEVDADERGVVRIQGARSGASASDPAPDDVALILHTSGSTGRPKRVPISHANLAVSAGNIARTYALSAGDVSLCVMPLFHVHGLVASTLAAFLVGGTVVVPARFNPLSFWRLVRDHRVTWYSAVPTIHQLLLSRAADGRRPAGAEHLRFIRSCSAALAPEVMEAMERVFGVPVLEAYGMTEAAHQMASNPLPPGVRKPGTVGRGTGVQLGIMDASGAPLPPGQLGEVVIKGPNVVRGYENNPEANASSFVDGWFRTGDQGVLDADGYLRLTGRIKELINRGGEKFSPREVDEVLLSHPAVAEAVAFGVPHPTWGEEVAAAVVLREPQSESALLAHCRERLADFKCPKKIHVVDAIPRTATGKVQRRAVADALAGAPR
jgi:acyl-CoA synthetase (AMP-forming)/AMP-acid ligase II